MTVSPPTQEITPGTHVFVDCENVPQFEPAIIGVPGVSVTLFVGARQQKLEVPLVEKLLEHAATVSLVRVEVVGRNALDFALAWHLGRRCTQNPSASFRIVSADKGFDSLVSHLRSRGVAVWRHDRFADLPFLSATAVPGKKASAPAPAESPFDRAVAHLSRNASNRPKKQATLVSHFRSMLGKDATDAAAQALVEQLRTAGHLSIDAKNAVTYHL